MLTFKTWASVVGASSAILLLSSVCGWIYRRFVNEDPSMISSFRTSVQFYTTINLSKAKTRALRMLQCICNDPLLFHPDILWLSRPSLRRLPEQQKAFFAATKISLSSGATPSLAPNIEEYSTFTLPLDFRVWTQDLRRG